MIIQRLPPMFGTQRSKDGAGTDSALKQKWRAQRGLLDIIADDPSEVIAFIAECSAPELHQFGQILGVRQEIEIYYAILKHKDCDRATALNIFMACDPAYYDLALTQGRTPEDMSDEEDQVFLAIAVAAHATLNSRRAWTSRFRINDYAQWQARPHASPEQYKFFSIPNRLLAPTKCEPALSPIMVEHATIGLSFEAWQQRH